MRGRGISDNVLVAFELLHYMKKKNKGQEGEVASKLDFSKAMGFNSKWIDSIMPCFT